MLDSAGRSWCMPSTRLCMMLWKRFVMASPSRTSCTRTLGLHCTILGCTGRRVMGDQGDPELHHESRV